MLGQPCIAIIKTAKKIAEEKSVVSFAVFCIYC